MTLIIVGLGPGDPELVTLKAWNVLSNATDVYLRTRIHPTIEHLPSGPTYHSFDDLYETAPTFEAVYSQIVMRLVERLSAGVEVVYAVPGDPMVAEGTVTRLLEICREKAYEVEIVNGVSFIEPALASLGVDAFQGLQLIDATDLSSAHHPEINPDLPALIVQLYSREVAGEVKLTLMNQYQDEHPVTLIHAAGSPGQRVEPIRLGELGWQPVDHLTALFVPRFDPAPEAVTSFEGFQETIAHLRAPEGGCPWDREQTHQSLRTYLLEETYEVLDAIDAEDTEHLLEELGDLLLQIVLHSQVAVDDGEFQMAEVIRHIDAKIKRRHPHVWGEVDIHGDVGKVVTNWEEIKSEERAEKGESEHSVLDGVSKALPALAQAHEYDRRAARLGFDWPDQSGVIDKVREELDEALEAKTPEEQLFEIGDVLFIVAVWARWLGHDPEDALRAANRRFYDRFTYIEKAARKQGRAVTDMTIDEMNHLWDERKAQQNSGKSE